MLKFVYIQPRGIHVKELLLYPKHRTRRRSRPRLAKRNEDDLKGLL